MPLSLLEVAMLRQLLSLAAALPLAVACENVVSPPPALDASAHKGSAEKPEVWSSSDAPTLFSAQLEMKLASLPTTGEAQMIPWASSYWPTYEDSINFKWDGAQSESPSAKYGRAYNITGVEDAVSSFRGIDSMSTRTKCTSANAAEKCKSEIGEQCAIRSGKTEGYCTPSWFGICHAWAPAAILVPEPKHEVEHNGVTFKVNDLKALATLVHDGVVNKFVSLRCEKDHRPGAEENVDVDVDENGRPTDPACRDSNAGSFHVLITNYLGLMKQSFVFDRTFDDEVWNQPLRGYNVTETRELTAVDANRMLGVTRVGGATTTLTTNVAQASWKHFDPIAVTAGTNVSVKMSGSGDGDLFVAFGAQPTDSTYACRPYQGGSDETCELTVPAGQTQLFVSVNGYSAANVSIAVTAGGAEPTSYAFNANARKLVYMKTDVRYIVESSASEDGNLASQIGRYTQTDRYEYILELDGNDVIVGGEWVGASKTFHPDFAWLPVRVRNQSVAGGKIKYADIKALLDRSIAEEGGGGERNGHEEPGGPLRTVLGRRGRELRGAAWRHRRCGSLCARGCGTHHLELGLPPV
jgi:Transglutaminase elicitor/Bacterial pre-peptidase C-terminal domain